MSHLRLTAAILIIGGGLASLVGCGGSSTVPSLPSSPSSPASGISVTLAQATTALDSSQSDAITATVHNDPTNKRVLWTVLCPTGMASCGSMASTSSASGVANTYTAPSSLAAAITVQIQAASAADHSKIAVVQLSRDLGRINHAKDWLSGPERQLHREHTVARDRNRFSIAS